MSTSFSSKLRGNCPSILFPCHLSFVLSAMVSFIFLVSLYTSVLRHLTVCNTAESVLCWCVLKTCISRSSFPSTDSTNFVIPTAWAAYDYSKPLRPCFLRTQKRTISAFRWCCPWIFSSFLVSRSRFCISFIIIIFIIIIIIIVVVVVVITIEFFTSQLWLGNIHLSWDAVINRIRLDGLICSFKSFLQLNMCQELQISAVVYMYSGVS
jgi:hypothetical protein